MLIYYLFPFVLYICSLFNFKNKKLKVFLAISLGVFLCTTYFNGSDWRQYEIMYNEATLGEIQEFKKEKGFYLYMLFFKLFNIDFFNFHQLYLFSFPLILSTVPAPSSTSLPPPYSIFQIGILVELLLLRFDLIPNHKYTIDLFEKFEFD